MCGFFCYFAALFGVAGCPKTPGTSWLRTCNCILTRHGWKEATLQSPWRHFLENGPASMTETLAATWKNHLCVSGALQKERGTWANPLAVHPNPSLRTSHPIFFFFLKGQEFLEIWHLATSTIQAAPKVSQVWWKPFLGWQKTCDMGFSDDVVISASDHDTKRDHVLSNASKTKGPQITKPRPWKQSFIQWWMDWFIHWLPEPNVPEKTIVYPVHGLFVSAPERKQTRQRQEANVKRN